MSDVVRLRDAMSPLLSRAEMADRSGSTFHGKRDMYRALGYQRFLGPNDYWDRYKRGGIAKRIVEAFPKSTWRSGGEVIEDENPDTITAFEQAWNDLNTRLKLWNVFYRTDVLCGLGNYAVILLGAPGAISDPLERCSPDDLKYLTPFSQRNIRIEEFVEDPSDERFSFPEYYSLTLRRSTGMGSATRDQQLNRVHYTRVIHVAEGALDDQLFGIPRLEAPWNYLDDLMKCVGGGSEAYWKRVDGGKQVKLDPAMPMPTDQQKAELHQQIEEYTHELRRVLTTRGVEIQDLGSHVSAFAQQVASIMDLIAATTGIPQRILMGSERGELASSQDQSNYDDRVEDRRNDFAEPNVVRPFVDRMIALGLLPEADYIVRWPEIKNLNDAQRMALAVSAANLNRTQGETIVTAPEIRDKILGFPPLTPEQMAEEEQKKIDKIQQMQMAFQGKAQVQDDGKPEDKKSAFPPKKEPPQLTDGKEEPPATAELAHLEAALVAGDFNRAERLLTAVLQR